MQRNVRVKRGCGRQPETGAEKGVSRRENHGEHNRMVEVAGRRPGLAWRVGVDARVVVAARSRAGDGRRCSVDRAGRFMTRCRRGPHSRLMAPGETRVHQCRTSADAEHEEQCDDAPQPPVAKISHRPEWAETPSESLVTVLNRLGL